jgi:hypothetical protein
MSAPRPASNEDFAALPRAPRRAIRAAAFGAACAAVLFGGCLEKRLVWAPDGSRAAVITKGGLYLCGPGGKLSPLLAPNVYRAAWLGDARLVLARSRDVSDSVALETALGPDRSAAIAAKAESAWKQLAAGRPLDDLCREAGTDAGAELLFLRERHGAGMAEALGPRWNELRNLPATVNDLFVAGLAGGRLEEGPVLYEDLAGIADIRPGPGGTAVAFATGLDPHSDGDFRIFVAPADAAARAALVAEHAAAFPDWTADGRALAYLQASDSISGDGLRLGALVRRTVVGPNGRIEVAKEVQREVALVFNYKDRVRCLKDGRIVFSAAEFRMPAVSGGGRHEQLFAYHPSPKPALEKLIPQQALGELPVSLAGFEVSPDETQVLFGGDDGATWLLTLTTGKVESVAPKPEIPASDPRRSFIVFAPVWRRAGEYTFAREAAPRPGRPAFSAIDVILRSPAQEAVLSASWPDDVLEAFVR